jgi:ribosomal protein S18 acetylase RimI-like enzyme
MDSVHLFGMASLLDLTIRPVEGADEREWCAQLMVSSEPWLTLGRTVEQARRQIQDPSREIYLAVEGAQPTGFLILTLVGPLPGYIQTVCVSHEHRGRGVGARLLAFAETRIFGKAPNVFLCVSTFNADARRLYERSGYVLIGELKDYLVAGHGELLLRKTRGPLSEFTAPEPGVR